jgi:flavin-dependent dehydrogenase
MAMAIQSALLAAPFILEGKTEEYRRRHYEFFASRIRWSRRVAYLLSRPGLLDSALRLRALGGYLLRRTRADRDDVARLADIEFTR